MITLRLDKKGGINKGDIKTFEHDNLSEVYIIQLYKNGAIYDLTNKTVELTIVEKKRKLGDMISLPIYEATEGKVKLEVVSTITKQDGIFDFKLTVKDTTGLIETFPNFQVEIKNDITDSITGEIIQDPNFTILTDGLKALADYNIYKTNALKVPEIEQDIVEINEQLDTIELKKSDITYVDNKVANIASGGPDRTLSTVDELNREYPNGDNKNKLVASDGHIYTYDYTNNIWLDTGIQYQSTGIADKSVTQTKLGDYSSRAFKFDESHLAYGFSNILNLRFSIGTLNSDGSVANNRYNIVSDFFQPSDLLTILPFSGVSWKIAKYTRDKVFVSINGNFTVRKEFAYDGSYYRIVVSNGTLVSDIDSLANLLIVGNGNTNPIKEMQKITNFVDGKIIKSNNILNPKSMTKGLVANIQGSSNINDIIHDNRWFVSEILPYSDVRGSVLVCNTSVKCRYYKNDILQATSSSKWDSEKELNYITILDLDNYDKVRFEIELYDVETTILSNENVYDGYIPYGYLLKDDVLNHRIKMLEKDNRRLYLPKSLYCLKGNKVIMLYDSFVSAINKDWILKSTASNGKYKLFKDRFIKSIAGDDGDWFYLHDGNTDKLIESKFINFKYAIPENKTITEKKNIMILGDSFIQANVIADDFKTEMDKHGYNLNYLGYVASPNGTKRMGYGGYRAWDFNNDPSLLRPQFPQNPFWNPTTQQVDFRYFVENEMNETILDYAVIHLGVNDKLTDNLIGESGNNEIVNRIVTLVNNIHNSYPDCKVFVDGLVMLSKNNEFANFRMYADDIFDYNSKLEKALSELSNTFYVPVATTFNSDFAYEYELVSAYKDSDETYKVVKEWLHPSTVGYHMIADQLIPCFIYNI